VLRILYAWLEDEGELTASPMARLRAPIIPEQPVPVCPRMGCAGCWAPAPARASRTGRDTALILLLVDVGPRRAALMGAKVADLDFDLDVLLVLGKGRRERALLLAIGHPEALSDPEPVDAVVVDGPAGLLRLDSRPPPAPTGRHPRSPGGPRTYVCEGKAERGPAIERRPPSFLSGSTLPYPLPLHPDRYTRAATMVDSGCPRDVRSTMGVAPPVAIPD
jgi:integrase